MCRGGDHDCDHGHHSCTLWILISQDEWAPLNADWARADRKDLRTLHLLTVIVLAKKGLSLRFQKCITKYLGVKSPNILDLKCSNRGTPGWLSWLGLCLLLRS